MPRPGHRRGLMVWGGGAMRGLSLLLGLIDLILKSVILDWLLKLGG